MTDETLDTRLRRLCSLPKVNIKTEHLTGRIMPSQAQQAFESEPPQMHFMVQLNDLDGFRQLLRTRPEFASMKWVEGEGVPSADTIVIDPQGFPLPYALAILRLDQLEILANLDSVRLIELNVSVHAI